MNDVLDSLKIKNKKLKIIYAISFALIILTAVLVILNVKLVINLSLLLICLVLTIIATRIEKSLIKEIDLYVKNKKISNKQLASKLVLTKKNNPLRILNSETIEEFDTKLKQLYNED